MSRAVRVAVDGLLTTFGPGKVLLGGEFVSHLRGWQPAARGVLVPTDWEAA